MKQAPHKIDPARWNPDSPYTIHKAYTVALGNRRVLHFTSRRLAAAYEADTKRWLKELILEANMLLGQLMFDHREAWPVLSDTGSTTVNTTDTLLREAIHQVERHLDRATVRHERSNGLIYVWSDVQRAFGRTADGFRALERFYQYKTQGVLRYRMACRAKQCENAIELMDGYGTNAPQR